jgi:hypothetical protein
METQTTRTENFPNIEAARYKFQAQVEDVMTWAEHRRRIRNDVSLVERPKFDGPASWTAFRREFDRVANHNGRRN